MDTEFIKFFTTLGVGGALAGMMFHFYRKDVQRYTSLWEGQSDSLMLIVKENTIAITRLTAVVEVLLRRVEERQHHEHKAPDDTP